MLNFKQTQIVRPLYLMPVEIQLIVTQIFIVQMKGLSHYVRHTFVIKSAYFIDFFSLAVGDSK